MSDSTSTNPEENPNNVALETDPAKQLRGNPTSPAEWDEHSPTDNPILLTMRKTLERQSQKESAHDALKRLSNDVEPEVEPTTPIKPYEPEDYDLEPHWI
jgi:hypothetical protein